MNDKKLFKFNWNCRRMGRVEGLFFATQKEVDASIGKNIYFGEILGKHSEVEDVLKKGDIVDLKLSQDCIDELSNKIKSYCLSGYNPLDYIEE